MKRIYLISLLLLIVASCQTKKDNQADIKAIHKWAENYMIAIEKADINKLLSQESDEICYLPPNQPLVKGKQAARKWLENYFKNFSPEEELKLQQVEISGEFAVASGNYVLCATEKKSGQKFSDNGKFINIFKRQPNGDWILTHSIWNSDNPPSGAN
jgi:ketosteroid isomerase-like protein